LESAKIGQCHKYKEYEIKPTNTIGLKLNTRMAIVGGPSKPPAMINAAPKQGKSAASPGNAVALV